MKPTRQVALKFDPFDRQIPALVSTAPITMAVAGARGGKTKAGCPRMIYDALMQEDYHPDDIAAGTPYLMAIGAPTFPMLQRIILPSFLAMCPPEVVIGKYHETRKRLRIRGRIGETHIYFLSGKAFESWMGMSLYRVWLDEFAQTKEALFDEIQTRLSDRKGRLLLTGTPQGPNWAYERLYKPWSEWRGLSEEERESDPYHPGREIEFYSWRTVDNPYIDRKFIEQKKRTMPMRFYRRTFEATWDTFEGQVYEEFLQAVHCKPRKDYRFKLPNGRVVGTGPNLIPLVKVVCGVDWGFAPGHSGVLLVGGVDTAGRWWLLQESVSEGVLVRADIGADSWITRAQALRVKWGIEYFICDTADPEAITQFKRAGLKCYGAVKHVKDGIEAVAKYLHVDEEVNEPRMFVLDDLRTTIDEVTYYHWKEGKEEPEKVADNTCDALRYLVFTQETRGRFRREPAYQP
jgi:hypothetical protein